MNNSLSTVPNQKTITVKKEQCDKQNYYAAINLNALESAALNLQSGAFKLWVYFAKNQQNYTFALSSKAVEENFGIKIKQYNNAVAELIIKGYLVKESGNKYLFYEIPNTDITKGNNDDITKSNNELLPNDTRNNTNNTNNNTKEKTFIF